MRQPKPRGAQRATSQMGYSTFHAMFMTIRFSVNKFHIINFGDMRVKIRGADQEQSASLAEDRSLRRKAGATRTQECLDLYQQKTYTVAIKVNERKLCLCLRQQINYHIPI